MTENILKVGKSTSTCAVTASIGTIRPVARSTRAKSCQALSTRTLTSRSRHFRRGMRTWSIPFGFRFETPDRTIVISGDTIPTQALIDHSRGCDILIHEAYSMASFREVPPHWQEYRQRAHTSTFELAEIANTVKPALLVIYHRSNAGGAPGKVDIEDVLIEEISTGVQRHRRGRPRPGRFLKRLSGAFG